jgi:hypothetical protein
LRNWANRGLVEKARNLPTPHLLKADLGVSAGYNAKRQWLLKGTRAEHFCNIQRLSPEILSATLLSGIAQEGAHCPNVQGSFSTLL